jgi:ribosome-associated protein
MGPGNVLGIGQSARRVFSGEAGNVIGRLDRLLDSGGGKVRRAGVATALAQVHRNAQGFVAVAFHSFELALAYGYAQSTALGGLCARVAGPQLFCVDQSVVYQVFKLCAGVGEAVVGLASVRFHGGSYDTGRAATGHIRARRCLSSEPSTMSRKPKKGYFFQGQFVPEGSALDLELKAELKGTALASRTELKRESTELQKLGESLLTLREGLLLTLGLPERFMEALAQARRITSFEGKRRQLQFVGKLMRGLEPQVIEAVRAALEQARCGSATDAQALHQAEQWRERLLAADQAAQEWLQRYPGSDAQQLRALVRQARKEAQPDRAARSQGLAPRHGRAYRELFQWVKEGMQMKPLRDHADA